MGETDACITASLHADLVHRAWSAEQGTTQPITGSERVLGFAGQGAQPRALMGA